MAIGYCFTFTSCTTDEPKPNIHDLVEESYGLGNVIRCCYNTGNECSTIYWETLRNPVFVDAVNSNQLREYFTTQNWELDFPELKANPEIVTTILERNPKGVFATINGDNGLVLLKDSTLGPVPGNTLYAFSRQINNEPCPGFPAE